ncbi:spore coat protein CotH [Paenibacillus sp. SYP-B3998]|uniref:Spore coat protein CotH n=1 Tax=Paenibacillus sp. SYP-B3998 TaxID=2678564 RepID=A0A6G3ZTG6_9BACL|nr:CotH kinase family protein [Paenibacillus sp. SYP-B3998]NEW05432.1 spore coat protein CotH [Paenibacillus sp. SYP-B3998]
MLPTRHIVIADQQLAALNEDVWRDQFVNAFIINKGIKIPIKVRYRGGHTREYPKKSYEIIKGDKTYHLNAEYDDPSLIRNALSFRFFQRIGVASPQTKHCHLKLNGRSLGVYLEIEAVDKNFFRRRKINAQSLFYAANNDANFELINPDTKKRKQSLLEGYQLVLGQSKDKRELQSFISQIHIRTKKPLYQFMQSQLDIDNYLRWLAGAVCTGNFDGFDQNYAIYRHKSSKLFRIIPWDYEGTWGRNCYGKACGSDLVRIKGYNRLTSKLMAFKSVRQRYKQLLTSILRTSFTLKQLNPVIDQMHQSIVSYVQHDSDRKWSYSEFNNEPKFIREYVKERREIILHELTKL